MKKEIYIKNSIYSVINYSLLIVLSLIVRKVLVINFPIEYTGYEALFSDIFTLLSIADMGMDSIISYKLYEEMPRNRKGILAIMNIARKMYGVIALVVFILGSIIFAFMPFFFKSDRYNTSLVLVIYIVQVVNLCISYLTGYKRLLLIADQKEYICLKWDSEILIIIQLSRIIVLGLFKNYYVYISLCIVQTLLQNIGVNIKCNKEYKELFCDKRTKLKTNYGNIKKDCGNFLCHRISSVIYSATDNLVITSLLGLATTGLYSNYYMISKYTYSFATKIMKPMQASIGNYLYEDIDMNEKIELLTKLNKFAYIFATFVSYSIIQLSTPFVILWLGDYYVLGNSLIVLLSINVFIAINQDFVYYFRNSFGKYEFDRNYMLMSAVTNLSLSIFLGNICGLCGVVIATIVGHLFIWYGRVKFVYIEVFGKGIKDYWINQFKLICLYFILLSLLELVTNNMGINLKWCFIREICVFLIIMFEWKVIGIRKNM